MEDFPAPFNPLMKLILGERATASPSILRKFLTVKFERFNGNLNHKRMGIITYWA